MTEEIAKLSGKLGIDTTDAKVALGAANRELRVLESGFRASAAALGDWTNDATGLENRVTTLTSKIDIQKSKVALLAAEHKRLAEENGANSKAAEDAEIKLNQETETLNKMQGELTGTEEKLKTLGQSEQEAGDEAQEMGNKMEVAKSVAKGFGAVIQGTLQVVLGLGAAAIAATAALGGLVLNTADQAGELVDLSTKTGISIERLQELKFAGEQLGTGLETITGANAKLIRSISDAADQQANFDRQLREGVMEDEINVPIDMAAAFNGLGVAFVDANGNLRDSQAVFAETIDALARIENPTERDALAMQLFGKSAQELNPLIKAGSDELATLSERAHEVGAVMAEEDVAAFEEFGDVLAELKAGLQGTLGTLAGAFLPGFREVLDQSGGYLQTFKEIVGGADGDFGKLAEGLGGLVTQIIGDVAAQIPQLLEVGLSIVQSILDAVLSALPTLIPAAIGILTTLITFITSNAPILIGAALQIVQALVNGVLPQLPLLIGAALQIITALASGIGQMLPTLIPTIIDVLISIVQTLIDNLPLLIDAAMQLILGLAQGLIVALPVLIAAIPTLVDALISTLQATGPQFAEQAGQLVGLLATGIVAAIPVLILAIAQLISVLGARMADGIKMSLETGKRFIQGMADGVKSAANILYDAVRNIVLNMIAEIESLLGIASPSKIGRGIMRNFVGSMGLGGLDAVSQVEQTLGSITQRLVNATVGGLSAGVANNSNTTTNTENIEIFGNVILPGSTPTGSVGAALKARRF